MFSLRFFGGFRAQRKAFLSAPEFAPEYLNPSVASELDGLVDSLLSPQHRATEERGLWRSCLHAVKPLLWRSAGANTISAFCVLASVLASKAVFDNASSLGLAFAFAFLFFAASEIDIYTDYLDLRRRAQIARGVQVHLFKRVNRKLLEIEPGITGELSKGNLKTLVGSDIGSLEDFITAAASNWIPTFILFVALVPVIYVMSGKLRLPGLLTALLQIPISLLLARIIERYQGRVQKREDELTTLVGEWVKNIRLVRYLGWQPAIENEIEGKVKELTIETAYQHALLCVTYGISNSWWMAPIGVMLLASPWLGIPLQLSSFFSSIWALNQLTNYLQHIPYSISLYGSAAAAAKRLNKLLDAPELRRFILPSDKPAPTGEPVTVRCSNVTVKFGDRVVVHLENLEIDLRRRTAIVGSVGSGKSLLLDLLTGERAPTTGSIEVLFSGGDWRPLWEESVYHSVREVVAYSPQQPYLSNTTLHKNIDLGDTLQAVHVEDAARRAQLSADIELFPRRFEEEVGETGINLSGGQKQRMSLARAFASRRPIFALDDPLSAVDRSTERKLMNEIMHSTRGFILVSHRLDELFSCDRILVLEGGSVVEDASPATLLAKPESAFNRFLKASREQEAAHG